MKLLRLALVGFIVASIAFAFAYAGGWLTPHALTPGAIIDRFEKLNGRFPGFRRNHAKGICVSGYFDGNGNGVPLSKAALFPKGRTPVVGRFAFAGGMPYVPDSPALVRSLAVLFRLSDGEEWRMAMINIPVFPVNTPEGFYEFLQATAPVPGTGGPDPARMKAFLAEHPETVKAISLIKAATPATGFADTTYNALNAFRFTNAEGVSVPVRWSMVPIPPSSPAPPFDPAAADRNALFDQLIADLRRQPLQWRLIVTVGDPGDSTKDATLPWPSQRLQINVGTLTIDAVESEDTSPTRDINFDPMILPSGIAGSDDPLLSARSAAYSQSFTRREGEPKTPSAISPAETKK